MSVLQPRSILQITLAGFLAVAGLLILALVLTVVKLDGLSDRGQRLNNRSMVAMNASRTLIEQAASLERNARQFSISGSEEILDVYADRRTRLKRAARRIGALQLGEDMQARIDQLLTREALAYTALVTGQRGDGDQQLFPGLRAAADAVAEGVEAWTVRQQERIREDTRRVQRLLTGELILLVGGALALAAIFSALITRPLGQVEKAINQLGSGLYDKPIRIRGPRDLVSLGYRLDWLRNRLAKLEQHRSSFLRHVSHELKTPLAAMQESASLLNEGLVGNLTTEQEEIIHILSNNCQRLQLLIDDLLCYNAESFSVLHNMPQPVRLDKVVGEVLHANELLIKTERQKIETSLSKATVSGDREQFRVVVDNLLTNAIKFSPSGAAVEIRLSRENDEVVLDIIDQGPGVAAQDRGRIFEAFYQGRAPDKSFLKGSGLGLAIVKEYVSANGGRIDLCDSERGAHFRLRFPAYRKEDR